MSNNIVEDVLLLPAIAAGVVAAVVTTAIGGVVLAGEGLPIPSNMMKLGIVWSASYYSICY